MTSTIQSTVASALSAAGLSQYVSHAQPVVDALIERDHNLVDSITSAVVEHFGVSAEQVQSQLASLGMAVRPAPEPEPEVEAPVAEDAPAKKGKKGKKGKSDKRVARLEAAVDKLTKLAERHLGASV